jgi:hypothetical protein
MHNIAAARIPGTYWPVAWCSKIRIAVPAIVSADLFAAAEDRAATRGRWYRRAIGGTGGYSRL